MNKIILLVLFVFCSNGCTLIGFYAGTQIDKSKHYSITNPTYDSLNIEIGTPISLHLNSDETINGRFSKSSLLNDSSSKDSTLFNNESHGTSFCTIEDRISSKWIISLHTHKNNVKIPEKEIKTIDVKPYSNTIIFATGIGIMLDILTYYVLRTSFKGPG